MFVNGNGGSIGQGDISNKINLPAMDYKKEYEKLRHINDLLTVENNSLRKTIEGMQEPKEDANCNGYMPEINHTELYIDPYSYDLLKQENEQLKKALINIALKL